MLRVRLGGFHENCRISPEKREENGTAADKSGREQRILLKSDSALQSLSVKKFGRRGFVGFAESEIKTSKIGCRSDIGLVNALRRDMGEIKTS